MEFRVAEGAEQGFFALFGAASLWPLGNTATEFSLLAIAGQCAS
jgi:hypothetical protein